MRSTSLFAGIFWSGLVTAQAPNPSSPASSTTSSTTTTTTASATQTTTGGGGNDGVSSLLSNMSLGVAMFALPKEEIVSATIENGIVRVDEVRKFRAGPWLQTQWVHEYWPSQFVKGGFFLGAEVLGGDQLIRSVGVGPVLQFRRNKEDARKAINLGVGVHWTQIQVLGSGLIKDQPVPTGIESIRYRKETQPGVVVNVSFGL